MCLYAHFPNASISPNEWHETLVVCMVEEIDLSGPTVGSHQHGLAEKITRASAREARSPAQ